MKNIEAMIHDVVSNYSFSKVPGILRIPAPDLDVRKAELTLPQWWVLAFFPFIKQKLYDWYDAASAVDKELVGEHVVVATNESMTSFNFYVPTEAFTQLLEPLRRRFHPVNYATSLRGSTTDGIRLFNVVEDTPAFTEAVLQAKSETSGLYGPLLTDVFANVEIEYALVSSDLPTQEMPRSEFLTDGRCQIYHKSRSNFGSKYRPGSVNGSAKQRKAIGMTGKRIGITPV
jgi:hypothetical protein